MIQDVFPTILHHCSDHRASLADPPTYFPRILQILHRLKRPSMRSDPHLYLDRFIWAISTVADSHEKVSSISQICIDAIDGYIESSGAVNDQNFKGPLRGISLLTLAATFGYPEVAKKLLQHGADLFIAIDGQTPILSAMCIFSEGFMTTLNEIIQDCDTKRPQLNQSLGVDFQPMQHASSLGFSQRHLDVMALFFDHGVPNASTCDMLSNFFKASFFVPLGCHFVDFLNIITITDTVSTYNSKHPLFHFLRRPSHFHESVTAEFELIFDRLLQLLHTSTGTGSSHVPLLTTTGFDGVESKDGVGQSHHGDKLAIDRLSHVLLAYNPNPLVVSKYIEQISSDRHTVRLPLQEFFQYSFPFTQDTLAITRELLKYEMLKGDQFPYIIIHSLRYSHYWFYLPLPRHSTSVASKNMNDQDNHYGDEDKISGSVPYSPSFSLNDLKSPDTHGLPAITHTNTTVINQEIQPKFNDLGRSVYWDHTTLFAELLQMMLSHNLADAFGQTLCMYEIMQPHTVLIMIQNLLKSPHYQIEAKIQAIQLLSSADFSGVSTQLSLHTDCLMALAMSYKPLTEISCGFELCSLINTYVPVSDIASTPQHKLAMLLLYVVQYHPYSYDITMLSAMFDTCAKYFQSELDHSDDIKGDDHGEKTGDQRDNEGNSAHAHPGDDGVINPQSSYDHSFVLRVFQTILSELPTNRIVTEHSTQPSKKRDYSRSMTVSISRPSASSIPIGVPLIYDPIVIQRLIMLFQLLYTRLFYAPGHPIIVTIPPKSVKFCLGAFTTDASARYPIEPADPCEFEPLPSDACLKTLLRAECISGQTIIPPEEVAAEFHDNYRKFQSSIFTLCQQLFQRFLHVDDCYIALDWLLQYVPAFNPCDKDASTVWPLSRQHLMKPSQDSSAVPSVAGDVHSNDKDNELIQNDLKSLVVEFSRVILQSKPDQKIKYFSKTLYVATRTYFEFIIITSELPYPRPRSPPIDATMSISQWIERLLYCYVPYEAEETTPYAHGPSQYYRDLQFLLRITREYLLYCKEMHYHLTVSLTDLFTSDSNNAFYSSIFALLDVFSSVTYDPVDLSFRKQNIPSQYIRERGMDGIPVIFKCLIHGVAPDGTLQSRYKLTEGPLKNISGAINFRLSAEENAYKWIGVRLEYRSGTTLTIHPEQPSSFRNFLYLSILHRMYKEGFRPIDDRDIQQLQYITDFMQRSSQDSTRLDVSQSIFVRQLKSSMVGICRSSLDLQVQQYLHILLDNDLIPPAPDFKMYKANIYPHLQALMNNRQQGLLYTIVVLSWSTPSVWTFYNPLGLSAAGVYTAPLPYMAIPQLHDGRVSLLSSISAYLVKIHQDVDYLSPALYILFSCHHRIQFPEYSTLLFLLKNIRPIGIPVQSILAFTDAPSIYSSPPIYTMYTLHILRRVISLINFSIDFSSFSTTQQKATGRPARFVRSPGSVDMSDADDSHLSGDNDDNNDVDKGSGQHGSHQDSIFVLPQLQDVSETSKQHVPMTDYGKQYAVLKLLQPFAIPWLAFDADTTTTQGELKLTDTVKHMALAMLAAGFPPVDSISAASMLTRHQPSDDKEAASKDDNNDDTTTPNTPSDSTDDDGSNAIQPIHQSEDVPSQLPVGEGEDDSTRDRTSHDKVARDDAATDANDDNNEDDGFKRAFMSYLRKSVHPVNDNSSKVTTIKYDEVTPQGRVLLNYSTGRSRTITLCSLYPTVVIALSQFPAIEIQTSLFSHPYPIHNLSLQELISHATSNAKRLGHDHDDLYTLEHHSSSAEFDRPQHDGDDYEYDHDDESMLIPDMFDDDITMSPDAHSLAIDWEILDNIPFHTNTGTTPQTGILWYILYTVAHPSVDDITTILTECLTADGRPAVDLYRLNHRQESILMHAIMRRWPQTILTYFVNSLDPQFLITHRDADGCSVLDYLHNFYLEFDYPEITQRIRSIFDSSS